MRLGIIKLSSLGDIIVAMSFLPALRERGYRVDWFVDSVFEEIVQNSPYIDSLISLPIKKSVKDRDYKTLFSIPSYLKKLEEYDLLIDMQGLIKSSIIGRWIPSKIFRGFGFKSCKEPLASIFYTQKIHIAYAENILKRNASILSLPLPTPSSDTFGFTQEAREKIFSFLQSNYVNSASISSTFSQNCTQSTQSLKSKSQNKKVLLLLEASKPTKMYPIKHFITLCENLKSEAIDFFVLYHSRFDLAQELCSKTQAKLLPKLNLDEIKALISQMDAVIGGDTGITHLAWAFAKPSITLYGNTPLERFKLSGVKNISLSGNQNARYQKNDFSIAEIGPFEIQKHLIEIL